MKIKNVYENLTPTPEQEEKILDKIDRKMSENKPKNNITVSKTIKRRIIPLVACFAFVVTSVMLIPRLNSKNDKLIDNSAAPQNEIESVKSTGDSAEVANASKAEVSYDSVIIENGSEGYFTDEEMATAGGADMDIGLADGNGTAFATPSDISIIPETTPSMPTYKQNDEMRAGMLNGGKIDDVADMEHFKEYIGQFNSFWDFPTDFFEAIQRDTAPKSSLDLMFTIDTTYSMADELSYLQIELADVISRVRSDNAQIPVNLSVNFYRDNGDEYIVKSNDFTTDIDTAIREIKAEKCDGGGDFEEAVETALINAIQEHEWSNDDNTAKLLFLVLDAPPHATVEIKNEILDLVKEAQEKGIVILPVAASGINDDTQRLLRQMAVSTGGTYQFLTDNSYGIGGEHLTPEDKEFEIMPLNDLLVDIINSYI
jgi:hypothetical protein